MRHRGRCWVKKNKNVKLQSNIGSNTLLQCLSHYPLFVTFPARISSCFSVSVSVFGGLFGFTSLWFWDLVLPMVCYSCEAPCPALGCLCFSCGLLSGDVVSLCWVSGSLVFVICHFVSCVFGIVCLCFCCDYYGMQLAAEPLPVYCPHPGPGIITDITRLFTMWEPR